MVYLNKTAIHLFGISKLLSTIRSHFNMGSYQHHNCLCVCEHACVQNAARTLYQCTSRSHTVTGTGTPTCFLCVGLLMRFCVQLEPLHVMALVPSCPFTHNNWSSWGTLILTLSRHGLLPTWGLFVFSLPQFAAKKQNHVLCWLQCVCVCVCDIGEQNERYTPKQRLEMSGKSSASLRSRHLYRRDEASPYMSEADPVSACTYIPLHLFFCLWLWDHSEHKLCVFRSSDSYRRDFLMMCLCLTALDAKWATNVILMMP